MKPHEAEAVITLLRRTLAVNQTGDTFTNINNDFYKAVVNVGFTEAERLAEYERVLRLILKDVNAALDPTATRNLIPGAPLGLDLRSLQYILNEALK